MQIGLVGLGKMGGNMRTRLRNGGHTVVGYDRDADLSDSSSLADMCEQLTDSPKVVWVMVPAGDPTRETVKELGEHPLRGRPGRRRRQLALDRRPEELRDARGARHRLRRLRRLRWHLGPEERLRADVRRRRRAGRQGAARARGAQARGRLRDGPRRSGGRRRPLRQDGPQRHRVRHDAGLRRGLGAAREGRLRRERAGHLRLLARGHRDPLLAARPAGRGAGRGHPPRRDPRLRRGLRRGPLDRRGGHRPRRPDARDRLLAVRAVHLPPGRQPRR